MKKVIIVDTSILCVWLQVPGKSTCGPNENQWNKARVESLINKEIRNGSTFVLPLATIIETGNHIAQSSTLRYETANALAEIILKIADETDPWAAFNEQALLWDENGLKELAQNWPTLASQKISIGDATIKAVADYYARIQRLRVEILTGDEGLKRFEPTQIPSIPRRRRS